MDGKGNLVLDLLDVSGDRIDDRVDVLLKHTVLSDTVQAKNKDAGKRLRFPDLDSTQGGLYGLQVFPLRHRPVGQFVRILEGKSKQQSMVLPVDPDRVIDVEFPGYEALGDDLKAVLQASTVEGREGQHGSDLYGSLDNVQKAGMLNIYAKMKATRFASGRDTFSFVTTFSRIRGDRFFAGVAKELRDEVKNSVHTHLFHEVSGALHTPPPGFVSADSF